MTTPGLAERLDASMTEASVALVVVVHFGVLLAAPTGLDMFALLVIEGALLAALIGIELLAGVELDETVPLVVAFVLALTVAGGSSGPRARSYSHRYYWSPPSP